MGRLILLTTLFIYSVNTAFTQDWQTFNSKTSYAFGEYFVVFDSVKTRGSDTLLYNFKNIRRVRKYDENHNVYSGIAPSWIGSVVVIKPNGLNVFLNGDNDSVYVETRAKRGTSFTVYTNTTKNLEVIGRVDSVVYKQVLGTPDSLKYITLFTNGHAGFGTKNDSITSLVLSKKYGLLESPAFLKVGYRILDPGNEIKNKNSLSGNTQIAGTFRILQVSDFFDFNIGDEFHTNEVTILVPNYFSETKRIDKVLSKDYSVNNDTLIYKFDVCALRKNPHTNVVISKVHSTVISKIALNETNPYFNSVPGKSYFTNEESPVVISWQSGDTKILGGIYFPVSCITPDSCYQIVDGNFNLDNYIKGFGGPYYDNSWGLDSYYRKLVYSKKNGVETGTPYNCESLLTSISDEETAGQKMKIYPNPASEHIVVVSASEGTVSIKNIIGIEVLKVMLKTGENVISLQGIGGGIYMVTVISADKRYTEKLIVQE